jgi:hypothetical protein
MAKNISLSTLKTELDELHQIHEKRQYQSEENTCYERLSLAQKVSASNISQFGFELKSVCGELNESQAIFTCGSTNLTVDYYGEVS